MVARRISGSGSSKSSRPPARTPDEREGHLVELATDLAEEQLRQGTASAQVIAHFLKLGSSRERLEQERLKSDIHVAKVKAELMASEARTEELMNRALDAIRGYQGLPSGEENDEFDDYEE